MGWQDREYASEGAQGGGWQRGYRGSGLAMLSMTTKIIVANVIIFFFVGGGIYRHLWMMPSAVWHGEIWRVFTATYLHANGMHIFLNMLMLYFFGPLLERRWGAKQFLIVYTIGGILGNILLTIGGSLDFIGPNTVGVGASGSVWTLMAAAAIYFPQTEIYIYFFMPVKLRTFVVVYAIWFAYNVSLQGANYGGDLCHLAGLGFGLYWAWSGERAWHGPGYVRPARVTRVGGGGWTKWFSGLVGGKAEPGLRDRVVQRRADSETIDAILAKVYDKGIHSLTPAERKMLTEATARSREEEQRGDRVGKA